MLARLKNFNKRIVPLQRQGAFELLLIKIFDLSAGFLYTHTHTSGQHCDLPYIHTCAMDNFTIVVQGGMILKTDLTGGWQENICKQLVLLHKGYVLFCTTHYISKQTSFAAGNYTEQFFIETTEEKLVVKAVKETLRHCIKSMLNP